MMITTAERKLKAGLTSLILDQPFYGSLALGLPFKVDPTQKTGWVDGRNIGYNPAFIDSLTHDQIVGFIKHEVSHVALGHPWRRDARDPKKWNIATDKVINHQLRSEGNRLPDNVYYAEGDEIGKSAEWVYTRLPDDPKPEPQEEGEEEANAPGANPGDDDGDEPSDDGDSSDGDDGEPSDSEGDGKPEDGPGDPHFGEVRDAPTTEDEHGNPAPTEQEWKQKVAVAAQMAKAMGNMPGGMAREVSEAQKPRLDVRSLLLRFFSERAMGDYSWTRPNRRYVAQGVYMPSIESKSMGRVGIMTDTSGSIDGVALSYARGIVESVIDECSPEGLTHVYADAAVKRVDRFEKGDPLTWEPEGGGGTNFIPALKFFEDEDDAVVCIVCITDLDGTFPEVPPDIPVLWLAIPRTWSGETTNESVAPFGETVPVEY